jgi:hypothetical protein
MPTFPIEWHKRGLYSAERSLAETEQQHVRQIAKLEAQKRGVEFMRAQIAEAERRGLDKFDLERFMTPRKSKGSAA